VSNDLLEVVGSSERLVHAEIFVLIVAVLEAASLILHGLVKSWHVDVAPRPSGNGFLGRRLVVVILSGSFLSLLLALVFGLLLVVGEVHFVCFFVVQVRRIGVFLGAQGLGEDEGGMVVDVVDGCVFGNA
jgi:hypothetical protein